MHADFAMLPARYSGGTHSFSRQVGLFSGVSAEHVVEKTVPLQCLFVIFVETMEEPVAKKARFAPVDEAALSAAIDANVPETAKVATDFWLCVFRSVLRPARYHY